MHALRCVRRRIRPGIILNMLRTVGQDRRHYVHLWLFANMAEEIAQKNPQDLALWLGEQGIPASVCGLFEGEGHMHVSNIAT